MCVVFQEDGTGLHTDGTYLKRKKDFFAECNWMISNLVKCHRSRGARCCQDGPWSFTSPVCVTVDGVISVERCFVVPGEEGVEAQSDERSWLWIGYGALERSDLSE